MAIDLPTKAVKAIIVENGKLLLLQRNPATRNGEDSWDLPGGLIEPSENPVDALTRECQEEIGMPVLVGDKATSWEFIRPKDDKTVFVQNYIVDIAGPSSLIHLSDEHIRYEWVSLESIATFKVKDQSFITSIQNLFS